MIRINLLKHLQTPVPAERIAELIQEPPAVRRAWLRWLLIFVIAVVGVYLAILSTRFESNKQAPIASVPAVQPVPVVAPQPKPVKSVVDSSVDTIQAVSAGPIAHLLRDLLAATTPGVGFSRVEFSSSNEFKVHGVASTETDLEHFQIALGVSTGIKLKEDRVVPVKTDTAAREFFFSGTINYPVAKNDSSKTHTVALNEMNTTLQDFTSTAKELNIDLEKPVLKDSSLFHGKRSFHYVADALCDYSDLQTLLEKLQANRSSVAFQHVTVEARGAEKMTATFELVLYAQ